MVQTESQTGKVSEYFSEYWKKNKKKFNEVRRDRYNSDPEYAEKVKAVSRVYREKKRKELLEKRKKEGKPLTFKGGGPRRVKTVNINGKNTNAYTIGYVSKNIKKPLTTINNWRKAMLLPDSPFSMKNGDRLYTDSMIRIIKKAVDKRDIISFKDRSLFEEIRSGWKKIGVV